jgi:hypothetical protein
MILHACSILSLKVLNTCSLNVVWLKIFGGQFLRCWVFGLVWILSPRPSCGLMTKNADLLILLLLLCCGVYGNQGIIFAFRVLTGWG